MERNTRKEFAALFSKIPLFLTGVFLLLFPLLFSIQLTEAFLLPKHILLAVIVTVSTITLGLHMVMERKIRLRTTPFDIPVLLFTLVVIVSAFLAVNRFDALIAVVPFLYGALLFYTIINSVRGANAFLFILACLVFGAAFASAISVLGFFNIYVLPFSYTKSPFFSSFGSLLDQALYLAIVLPIAGYFAVRLVSRFTKKKKVLAEEAAMKNPLSPAEILFSLAFVVLTAGLVVTLIHLVTSQKPLLLPMEHGFQIAFAAISQDAGRILKGFLFGSGYGTFLSDFLRFKPAAYNASETLWSVTFLRSSSFILELLATTGLLGALSFLFIVFRVIRERSVFLPLIVAIIAAFLMPFSPLQVTLFFTMLGIFAVVRSQANVKGYDDVEFKLVALRQKEASQNALFGGRHTAILPGFLMILLVILVGVTGYYAINFIRSDMTFQRSLVAASQNNGSQTYALQNQAIQEFPYRDVYYRVFSQTNLALANALAQQASDQQSSPSAQTQQNVLTLIQQSINSARSATNISPYTALNWNNLSGVYRSLIGFGENADRFSVLTNQQAIVLDPNNPQQYVNLGGIYYQLGLWDDAIRQFQIAIQLKPNYANAYYNIGHALESKNDLARALNAYEIVKSLITNDAETTKKITAEIDALKAKVGNGQQQVAGAETNGLPKPEENQPAENQEPIDVNKPAAQLPTRSPKAPIEGPEITPTPTSEVTPSPSEAPQQ